MKRSSNLITNAERVSKHLRVLSNSNRLRIVCNLLEGEIAVSELMKRLDLPQPHLSSELGKLRNAGIIHSRRDGLSKHYSLISNEVTILVEGLCEICERMDKAA